MISFLIWGVYVPIDLSNYLITCFAVAGLLYNVSCCAGISISLLLSLSRDLGFSFDLYLVADGLFGSSRSRNGIAADLVSGAAHMTMAAFSMTSARQADIDFSVPYFHSGVSCLTSSQYRVVPVSASVLHLFVGYMLCWINNLKCDHQRKSLKQCIYIYSCMIV